MSGVSPIQGFKAMPTKKKVAVVAGTVAAAAVVGGTIAAGIKGNKVLKEINAENKGIIASVKKGYSISWEKVKEVWNKLFHKNDGNGSSDSANKLE